MKTILEYLQNNDQNFSAPCNGKKNCGKCKIKIINRLVKINEDDRRLLSESELADGYRLACSHRYHENDQFIIPKQIGIIEDNIYLNEQLDIINPIDAIGVIVDIGTTTVVIKKIDLTSGKIITSKAFFNPQRKFGSDVIARIEFDNNDPGNRLGELIIDEIFKQIKITKDIKEILICGNATMINLFLKEKVRSIGMAPFTVPVITMTTYPASHYIETNNNVDIITMNHISAYVGSDIVMGIYAADMDKRTDNCLLIDLGTNGEMVAGNYQKLLATSCPAGPAFEGVNIECGGPSISGAICSSAIVDNQLTYKTIDQQAANSICGSGLISLIANMLRLDIIDNFGNFKNGEKKYYLTDSVYLSVKDIKAFMLAKAAIQAGKDVLLKELNEEISTIYLAGGFGNYLKKEDLVLLNIIDEANSNKVQYIKNSAISGLYKLLITREFKRVNDISKLAKVIYLEKDPDFNDYWIDAMEFE